MFISSFICVRLSRPNHYQQTIFINNLNLEVLKVRILKALYFTFITYAKQGGYLMN